MIQCWRLDDSHQTVVVAARDHGLPEVLYWGARLPDAEDLETLAANRLDVTGGMMDENAPISVCPEAARAFPGQPGFLVLGEDGRAIAPKLTLDEINTEGGLGFRATDPALGISYFCRIERTPDGLIEVIAVLEAPGYSVPWLAAPVLPVPTHSDGLIDFSGRWIGEFQPQRHDWRPGIHMREARLGRSGHEHPPFAIVTTPGLSNTKGEAWSYAYDWTGGHRMIAEELPDGRRQLQFGHPMASQKAGGARTARVIAGYSAEGLNGVAKMFQQRIRQMTAPKSRQPRPVHYNCWEAVYFDHDPEVLQDIARRAADLGAERFVLDDGWFGRRDDDTTSLGDWDIDPRKWPEGLAPFANFVNDLGMGFGLWVEPEMISQNSDLFRAHPDWVLGPADQVLGRQQLVLDMSRRDVREYLFEKLSDRLFSAPIEYLKWDHNRLLPLSSSAQGEGILSLLSDLNTVYPQLEIESCASGGGRIDTAILRHTRRVWLSDSNDALERLRIQHDAALFLPGSVTGSHVGPRHCHTSGRVIDIRMRAWVAAQRHMGFEMDPRELTEDEAQILRDVTAWWKANRDWMGLADILRLDSADPAVIAEQQMARDGSRFVVFAGRAAASQQIAPRPLRLTGLAADQMYSVDLRNRAEAPGLSRGDQAVKSEALTLSGAYLMNHGLSLPWSFPGTMWVVEGKLI